MGSHGISMVVAVTASPISFFIMILLVRKT